MQEIYTRPDLQAQHERFAAKVRAAGLPEIFAKIYGRITIVRPEEPYNANETGNEKVQDMYGAPSSKPGFVSKPTGLDIYGALGGANPGVSLRYQKSLQDAAALKIPGIVAQVYNSPAVQQTREPYDVAQGQRDETLGIVGRVYAGRTPVGTEKAAVRRSGGDKFLQWIRNGEWK